MKEKEWREKVRDFKGSGKSQREWCREKGITRGALRYWLNRMEELSDGKEVVFAELCMIGGDEKC